MRASFTSPEELVGHGMGCWFCGSEFPDPLPDETIVFTNPECCQIRRVGNRVHGFHLAHLECFEKGKHILAYLKGAS